MHSEVNNPADYVFERLRDAIIALFEALDNLCSLLQLSAHTTVFVSHVSVGLPQQL